jgi:hypothetical protein
MKADVACFKVLTGTNGMAIKVISRCLFYTRCKWKLRISKVISTYGIRGG